MPVDYDVIAKAIVDADKDTAVTAVKEDLSILIQEGLTDLDAAKNADIPFILVLNRFNEKLAESYKGKIITNFMEVS